MGSAMASTAPQDQITALIQQVADENGLEIKAQLENTPVGTGTLETERPGSSREDDLERRFDACLLRALNFSLSCSRVGAKNVAFQPSFIISIDVTTALVSRQTYKFLKL